MTPRSTLRRLHQINTLFAPLTGDDLYLAEQIRAAITTSLEELDNRPPADPAFAAAAAKLLDRLYQADGRRGFHHWDAVAEPVSATPLFTRAQIIEGLKRLAGFRESTLLVTNLHSAHCPPSGRWSKHRRAAYQESLAFIRELAARRSRRDAHLHIFFI